MPKKKIPNHAGLVPLLTAEQVVSHLNISLRTLYRLVDSRKLTCYKLDGLLRFNPADVRIFLGKRAIRGSTPAPFEEVKPEPILDLSNCRVMTDEEARDFFAGVKRDEEGNLISQPGGNDD